MAESEDEMNRINQATIRTEQEHDRMDEEIIRIDDQVTRSGQEIQATTRTEQEHDRIDEEIIRTDQEITRSELEIQVTIRIEQEQDGMDEEITGSGQEEIASMEEESAMSMQRRTRIEPELRRTEQETTRLGQEQNDERHDIDIYDRTAVYGNNIVLPQFPVPAPQQQESRHFANQNCPISAEQAVIEQNYLEDNTLQMFLPSYSEECELENIVMQSNLRCPERDVVEQRFNEDPFSIYVPANPEEQQSINVSLEHSPTLFEGGIIEENYVSDDDIPIFVTTNQNEEENNGSLLLHMTGPDFAETEETYENNVESGLNNDNED